MYNPDSDSNYEPSMVMTENSLENMMKSQGLYDAVNKENQMNQEERSPEDYASQLMGDGQFQPAEEPNDYDSFVEEVPDEPKPKKKYNDSKKRINQLTAEKKAERDQKENALIRAEVAERELKRIADEKEFLLLSQQKQRLDDAEDEASYLWEEAHHAGDSIRLREMNTRLQQISDAKRQKEAMINDVADRYTRYKDEEDEERSEIDELQRMQYDALVDFSDKRELESPLYDGFLAHHEFIDPRSDNFDSRMSERVEPVKFDFIQELKLNGQADMIGTKDFFEELSSRIHFNLNPRLNQRGNAMNQRDPRYQQPVYMQPQQYAQYQQPSYGNQQPQQQPQWQNQYPQQQQPQQWNNAPQQQMQYGQPQMQYNQQQGSVAPVNRSGYSNNYSTDPRNIQLDDNQREAAGLFGSAINELSQKVYGRSMDTHEVEDLYKRGMTRR